MLVAATHLLGAPVPDPDDLDLGEEHEAVAAESGGAPARVRALDSTVRHLQLPVPVR